jgi:hypothetical protein
MAEILMHAHQTTVMIFLCSMILGERWLFLLLIFVMKRKTLNRDGSTIPPISTKGTTTSHLKSLNIKRS